MTNSSFLLLSSHFALLCSCSIPAVYHLISLSPLQLLALQSPILLFGFSSSILPLVCKHFWEQIIKSFKRFRLFSVQNVYMFDISWEAKTPIIVSTNINTTILKHTWFDTMNKCSVQLFKYYLYLRNIVKQGKKVNAF